MPSKSAKSLLHFDDVIKGTGWGHMPNQYEGLNWSRMGVIDHEYYSYLSGYETGNVSPDYTVWTYSEGVSTISSATSFSVYSLFATPAWSTGMFVNTWYNRPDVRSRKMRTTRNVVSTRKGGSCPWNSDEVNFEDTNLTLAHTGAIDKDHNNRSEKTNL